jgi:hypothetical protein
MQRVIHFSRPNYGALVGVLKKNSWNPELPWTLYPDQTFPSLTIIESIVRPASFIPAWRYLIPANMSPTNLRMDADGVVSSKLQADIPNVTLPRWGFKENTAPDPHKPILIDSARPKEL